MTEPPPEQGALLRQLETALKRAVALHQAGRLAEARPLYETVLRALPRHAETLYLYGTLLSQQGEAGAAIAPLEQAVAIDPSAVHYRIRLGAAQLSVQRVTDAIATLSRATELAPELAEARTLLALAYRIHGTILLESGDAAEAIGALSAATDLDPLSSETAFQRARAHRMAGQREAQHGAASRAVALAPEDPRAYLLLAGSVFLDQVSADRAVRLARRAVALDPLQALLWGNLALNLIGVQAHGSAAEAARRALVLDPAMPEVINALANTRYYSDRYHGVRRAARQGLALQPDHGELAFVLCQASFCLGDIETAWSLWKRRTLKTGMARHHGLPPEWRRDDPVDGRLLVCAEQGIGDEILYLSCLPDLLREVPEVAIEVDPRWHPLFARSWPDVMLVPRLPRTLGTFTEEVDYTDIVRDLGIERAVLAGDLPMHYRRPLAPPTTPAGYLKADPDRVASWRTRLARLGPAAKVGICWRSGFAGLGLRSSYYLEIDELLTPLPTAGCHLVSLQYGETGAELERARRELGIEILDPGFDQINDLDEVAALIAALDLVIAASTAVLQLAGAIGTPTLALGKSSFWSCAGYDPLWPSVRPMLAPGDPYEVRLALERVGPVLTAFLAGKRPG